MITDNTRILIADPRGHQIARQYLQSIEAQNLGALKRMMSPDVELVHTNYVQGREAAAEMIRGYLAIVAGVEFEVRTLMGDEGCYAIEKVNVAVVRNGATARVRVVTVLEIGNDTLLTSIRIYADTSELFRKLEPPSSTPPR